MLKEGKTIDDIRKDPKFEHLHLNEHDFGSIEEDLLKEICSTQKVVA